MALMTLHKKAELMYCDSRVVWRARFSHMRTMELIEDDLKKHNGDHVAIEVDDPEDSDEEMEEGTFNW
eukprot:6455205-Amphidinium_carterae.1